MIRRPSYKQFLNQTKEVQSSINLSFNDPPSSYPHGVDSSQNEIKSKQKNVQRPWENKYLDVVKYLPDDPRALRHTYAKEPYGRSTINDSFNKSFQMLSPNRDSDQINFKRVSTNTYPRPSYRQQPKKQVNQSQHPLEFTRCYVGKPIDPNQQANSSFSKCLYQSKSSTKLLTLKNDNQIQKEIERLKQLRNRRMQNNGNIMYRYEDKLQKHSIHNPPIPKSSVSIAHWEDKENKAERNSEIERKKETQKGQKERAQMSKSPIRAPPVQHEQKSFTPIQFKKIVSKHNDEEKNINRQPSKSPLKRISNPSTSSKTEINLLSASNINEASKQVKPKTKSLCLNDFILGKKLGEGRFGVVWLATHKLTGAIFALKKIAKSTVKGNFMIQQFILQVKIQSFIENPYIVKIYGDFDDEENIYLLLEYLEGGSLYNLLKTKVKGKLAQEEAATRIRMICQAVNCLHEKGIAHRDIKPENIIITNQICKLGDFGWATCCDQRRKTYCGTTDYVAPEIVQGLQYDMSVDLWCIGVLTYELLSGRAPFYHISRQQTFNKIKNVDASSINYPDYFTSDAIDFIGRLIKKNPNERMNMPQAVKHPFITKYHF